MTPIWNAIGRLVVAFVFGPVDRTVCRFANVTHAPKSTQ